MLSGLSLIVDSLAVKLGVNISVFSTLFQGGIIIWLIALLLAYMTGHVLTAIHARFFRGKEKNQAITIFGKNEWLKSRIGQVVSSEMEVSLDETEEWLENSEIAENIREIGRSIVHLNLPELYREFVGRHSILSRFCQNLAIAILILTASVSLSAGILWDEVFAKMQTASIWGIIVLALFFALIIMTVIALFTRSSKLRQTMTKHTFQLWYVASLEAKKGASKTDD